MTEPNLMPSDDVASNETTNESPVTPPATGSRESSNARVADALAEAIVRFAEAQHENLALLQELSKSVTELKQAQQDKVDNHRLTLELEALRREPKVPLGWLVDRVRVLTRKGLKRSAYGKLDFQLRMERSFEASGIPATVAWVEDAVAAREVPPQVAYSLLLPALVLRKDIATADAVAGRVRERYPDNVALQKVIEKVSIGLVGPTPRISGDSIVWRSKLGARKHKLALPTSRVGQAAWDRAKSLQALRTRPSMLTALGIGNPAILPLFSDYFDEVESSTASWRNDLASWVPDLVVVDYRALANATHGEGVDLEQLVRICESSATLPVLWVDADGLAQGLGSTPPNIPKTVVTLVDAESTKQRLRQTGFQAVMHVVGPVADTNHRELTAASKRDTLVLWDVASNAHTLRLAEAKRTFSNWLIYDLGTNQPSAELVDASGEGAPEKRDKHTPRVRDCIAIAGDTRTASHEELVRLSQALARGSALFVHKSSAATLVGPLAKAPHQTFESLQDLANTLTSLEQTPHLLLRQQYSSIRFARENLGKRAAFARIVAHSGAPSVGSNARRVSVLCVSNRPERVRHCLETYRAQTYPHKQLIFVANLDNLEDEWVEQFIGESPDVTLLRSNGEYSLGESLNRARAAASGELWAKFDDDDHYGANYLRDMVLALEHSEAAVAGKGLFFAFDQGQNKLYLNRQATEQQMTERFICGGTIVADRRFVENVEFQPVRHGTDSLFLQHCKLQGFRIFCADRYNYAYIRYPSPDHHTYAVANEKYLKSCSFVCEGFDKSIIDI